MPLKILLMVQKSPRPTTWGFIQPCREWDISYQPQLVETAGFLVEPSTWSNYTDLTGPGPQMVAW